MHLPNKGPDYLINPAYAAINSYKINKMEMNEQLK
jgi:hypothetical protein